MPVAECCWVSVVSVANGARGCSHTTRRWERVLGYSAITLGTRSSSTGTHQHTHTWLRGDRTSRGSCAYEPKRQRPRRGRLHWMRDERSEARATLSTGERTLGCSLQEAITRCTTLCSRLLPSLPKLTLPATCGRVRVLPGYGYADGHTDPHWVRYHLATTPQRRYVTRPTSSAQERSDRAREGEAVGQITHATTTPLELGYTHTLAPSFATLTPSLAHWATC